MACTKCSEPFRVEAAPSKIYWVSEFDELMRKSLGFLKQLGYTLETDQGVPYVAVENGREFFITNVDAIKLLFSEHERNDIKLAVVPREAGFTYQALILAKPLQRYVNLVDDSEFFDILDNESLTSHFQPIVRAKDRTIYGYETLIRGVKGNGELVYPGELFDKSRRNDMTFRFDRLCRETALKTAAVKKISQKVFINFIPTSIYDPEFCLSSTVKWANQLEFDPKNIVFEVVETESVEDQAHLHRILTYYRDQGFKIALDDVGAGYSNLNMLMELRPDIIKVDREIISNIHTDGFKQSVYRALVSIARDNGIEVLAEGVETPYEIEAVEAIGVDYMQGYYFSKPVPEPVRVL